MFTSSRSTRARTFALTLVLVAACFHPKSGVSGVSTPVMQASQDRAALTFAGVDLVPTGHGGFYVHILSGMVGSGDPLYVIDGAPMMIPPDRGIDWFKPEDIKELKVLKGPAETAVYGPRGVNGVIVISTRQARKRVQ